MLREQANVMIGKRLKRLRELARLSQKDIFKTLGLSSGALSLMEAGKSGIQSNTLFALSEKIGYHPGMFFLRTNLASEELERQTNDFLNLVEGESYETPEIRSIYRSIYTLMENIKVERKRALRAAAQ